MCYGAWLQSHGLPTVHHRSPISSHKLAKKSAIIDPNFEAKPLLYSRSHHYHYTELKHKFRRKSSTKIQHCDGKFLTPPTRKLYTANKLAVLLLTNVLYRPVFMSGGTASFVPGRMVRWTGITLSTQTMWSPTRLSLVVHQHVQRVFMSNTNTHIYSSNIRKMQKLLTHETTLRHVKSSLKM